jgi:hypothetical protein
MFYNLQADIGFVSCSHIVFNYTYIYYTAIYLLDSKRISTLFYIVFIFISQQINIINI